MSNLNLGFHFAMGIAITGVIYGFIYLVSPREEYRRPPPPSVHKTTGQALSEIDFTRP